MTASRVDAALDSLDEEAKAFALEVLQRRSVFLDRINIESIDIDSDSETEPYASIKAAEYNEFRYQ